VPIDYEAFGNLGGVGTMQDGRQLMPGDKQPRDFCVHRHLFLLLSAYQGGAAEKVEQFVRERYVRLAESQAVSEGDESGGEVDFGEPNVGEATADGDVLRVTEQCVEQVEERRNVVHAPLIDRPGDACYVLRQTFWGWFTVAE